MEMTNKEFHNNEVAVVSNVTRQLPCGRHEKNLLDSDFLVLINNGIKSSQSAVAVAPSINSECIYV
jgi:hypothetical protein